MASKQSDKNDADSQSLEWVDPADEGNAYYARKEFMNALEAYSRSIDKYPHIGQLYTNRSLVQSKLNRPIDALFDIETALGLEPNNEKFLLRKCIILMGLRRFTQLDEYLHESIDRLKHLANDKAFATLTNRMKRIKTESDEGRYDFSAMAAEAKKSKILDKHADYFARKKLEIREIEGGKGRGVIAVEQIQPGELLMACEAFVLGEHEPERIVSAVSFEHDYAQMETPKFAHMIEKTIEKLVQCPSWAADFYRLYAGPKLGHLVDWEEDDSPLIDTDRIKSILRFNKFGIDDTPLVLFEGFTRPPVMQNFGVWIMPSYVNHSCVDTNCLRYAIGDFMFVVATKPIEKGQELMFTYTDAGEPFEQRQLRNKFGFGFECQCRLCLIERQDSDEIKERFDVIRKFVDDLRERPGNIRSTDEIDQLENYLKELLEYRPQLDLNPLALKIEADLAAAQVNTDSGEAFAKWREVVDVRKASGELFEALCFCFPAIRTARLEKRHRLRDKWSSQTREIAKMIFCGDERAVEWIENL